MIGQKGEGEMRQRVFNTMRVVEQHDPLKQDRPGPMCLKMVSRERLMNALERWLGRKPEELDAYDESCQYGIGVFRLGGSGAMVVEVFVNEHPDRAWDRFVFEIGEEEMNERAGRRWVVTIDFSDTDKPGRELERIGFEIANEIQDAIEFDPEDESRWVEWQVQVDEGIRLLKIVFDVHAPSWLLEDWVDGVIGEKTVMRFRDREVAVYRMDEVDIREEGE